MAFKLSKEDIEELKKTAEAQLNENIKLGAVNELLIKLCNKELSKKCHEQTTKEEQTKSVE